MSDRINAINAQIAGIRLPRQILRFTGRQDRLSDLDKGGLPDSCPGDIDNPRLSIQGHKRIIRSLKTDQLIALAEYVIRNCSNEPPLPPIPVPVPAPTTKTLPAQTSTATGIVIAILALIGLAVGSGSMP